MISDASTAEERFIRILTGYLFIKNRAGICRIGITVSKKTGNAVQRNRSKRIIRAAYSAVEESICGNWDFVFVARGKTKYLKSTDIQKS